MAAATRRGTATLATPAIYHGPGPATDPTRMGSGSVCLTEGIVPPEANNPSA
jgi:hypothetical protein